MVELMLGTRKGLVTLAEGSSGFRVRDVAFAGVPVEYAFCDPRTGARYAALEHGHWGPKLHRSDDWGATWRALPAPAYPEGERFRDHWTGQTKAAVLEHLWVVAPGGADQPGVLYAGTNPGGLFRSDDGGAAWRLIRGLWDHPSRLGVEGGRPGWFGGGRDTPGLHSIFVDPRDSRRVFVGVSCGGVFETRDGGETWASRNQRLPAPFLPDDEHDTGHDPHFVAPCPTAPDVLWQQNHVGVFRSADAGRSWVDVSEADGPVGFGFPIAPGDHPDVAWVVPAVSDEERAAVGGRLRVCRTEDGGATWQPLTRGLPQEGAFDLVYRHALDRDGERLAFGSTTGNVFLGRDGGDRWTCLGHHFPPVYSVRFARN